MKKKSIRPSTSNGLIDKGTDRLLFYNREAFGFTTIYKLQEISCCRQIVQAERSYCSCSVYNRINALTGGIHQVYLGIFESPRQLHLHGIAGNGRIYAYQLAGTIQAYRSNRAVFIFSIY